MSNTKESLNEGAVKSRSEVLLKHRYTDENGLVITAVQGRLLERRKRVAELYREMLPRYASFKQLYRDIADIINSEQVFGLISDYTVVHDLKHMGLHNTTAQSRTTNNIRKESV